MFLFPADLWQLYYQAGVENKPTVFLFPDTQVVEEAFLEDINNILSSGEVPNLYKPDEFEEVCMSMILSCMHCVCVYVWGVGSVGVCVWGCRCVGVWEGV